MPSSRIHSTQLPWGGPHLCSETLKTFIFQKNNGPIRISSSMPGYHFCHINNFSNMICTFFPWMWYLGFNWASGFLVGFFFFFFFCIFFLVSLNICMWAGIWMSSLFRSPSLVWVYRISERFSINELSWVVSVLLPWPPALPPNDRSCTINHSCRLGVRSP